MSSPTAQKKKGIMKLNCKKSNGRGFTLIELLIVIAMITIIGLILVIGIGGMIMGNEWFTRDGVLGEIQLVDTNAVSVATCQRNIFRKSIITVKEKDGQLKKFSLNSDVLFNYDLKAIN